MTVTVLDPEVRSEIHEAPVVRDQKARGENHDMSVVRDQTCRFSAKVRHYFDVHQDKVHAEAYDRLHDLLAAFLEATRNNVFATCDECIYEAILALGPDLPKKARKLFTRAVHEAVGDIAGREQVHAVA